jgi:peptidoglycan L-alanyl-D-glutamate endopeptidase CwlK
MKNTFKFGTKSKQILNNPQISGDIRHLCNMALQESEIDFSIIDGYRTALEQNALYKNKKTDFDGFVLESKHQSGNAIDVLPYVKDLDGNVIDCWDYKNPASLLAWQEVHRAFLRSARILGLNIELGVTYIMKDGSFDYPHIQINSKA